MILVRLIKWKYIAFNGIGLVPAKDVLSYYFKRVAAYYQELLKTNNFLFTGITLRMHKKKLGDLDQALISIDKALALSSPIHPEKYYAEKRQQIKNHQGNNNPSSQVVIDWRKGRCNWRRFTLTYVFLSLQKRQKEALIDKTSPSVVRDGKTNMYERIPLKENVGYNPTLFLGDLLGIT